MSVNKVILVGRLGQDPELKYTPSGTAFCNFSLATNDYWMDKATGTKQEKTEWHRVVVWGKTAERANQYLKKGREVYIEGKLQTRSWEQEGTKKYITEVVALGLTFLGGNASLSDDKDTVAATDTKEYAMPSETAFVPDDVPF